VFDKVLIANRGAIATRIIRSLRRLGIASVAVYAEADAQSRHVRLADEAHCLGEGGAADTYLHAGQLLAIAAHSGAQAIHPGYGFLSENADFVRRCEAAGIAFLGPTAEQIEAFGLKHRARALALANDVPLSPGSELLPHLDAARCEAQRIGYPVMLKSAAGGGGIGMQLCADERELAAAWDSVRRLGANNFADDSVYLEKFIPRARHVEVQVFGDGAGGALAIGERDCSSQRRNQKVVEECPAPNLSQELRHGLHATAERLLAGVSYRSAGTVEFILDADSGAFYFLEVNTRLQVEHGVTEEVFGIDLVEWMLQQAAGTLPPLETLRSRLAPAGHAIQVRLYAEDPYRGFRPCADLLSRVRFPQGEGVRVDHWVEAGVEIPPHFDPMLAKLIVHAPDRRSALERLREALEDTELYGSVTNLEYLRALSRDPVLASGAVTTRYLNEFRFRPRRIDVVQGGTLTTVQDYPGRSGHWDVGVPPSGPFDSYSFRLGNRLLGNAPGAAGLEITLHGPVLQFSAVTCIVLAGATLAATLDGEAVPMWHPVIVTPGQTLALGRIEGPGARSYLLVEGGLAVPAYLGSAATFTLGRFGGHNGRALRAGDVLPLAPPAAGAGAISPLPAALRPELTQRRELRVTCGPHGAPDFFTEEDIATFFATDWEVHYNSSRTGIRLIGPRPRWARPDGGEAGLHPSNIHDNAYAFGTVDFTGDMPVILGPDGPSLGGFVCPATVITADLWQLGQLRAGDRVRFVPVSVADAVALEGAREQELAELQPRPVPWSPLAPAPAVLATLAAAEVGDEVVYRQAGDHFLLVEYGPQALDLRRRFRAHALMQWLRDNPLAGLKELTPGIRSLQVHFDSQRLDQGALLAHLQRAERQLAAQLETLSVPSRVLHLPLSWDDGACQEAVDRYLQSVRPDAPWCPSNPEFIRRINGLDSVAAVRDILFEASYLVMGLGDVYLGAPVAVPVDPRHRLVTTKYNPARTWTAENSVGIGGSYLCIYGMEGPGGYQFVGRTLQMWNPYRRTREFEQPWLLRFFDQIRFYPVSHEELGRIRRDFPQGRYPLRIEETEFRLEEYEALLAARSDEIAAFRARREAAFAAELAHWHATGQFEYSAPEPEAEAVEEQWPAGTVVIDSPVSGSVWQAPAVAGKTVRAGEILLVLESMKMEIPVAAPCDGVVGRLLLAEGARVRAGQALVVLEELS